MRESNKLRHLLSRRFSSSISIAQQFFVESKWCERWTHIATHTDTYTHTLHDLRKTNGFRSLCWCRMAVRAEWDAKGCYQIVKSQNRAACIYLFCDFHSSTQLIRWRCILRRWCRQSINNGKVITRQTTSIANIFGRLDGTWTTNKIRNYYDRNVSSSPFRSFPRQSLASDL